LRDRLDHRPEEASTLVLEHLFVVALFAMGSGSQPPIKRVVVLGRGGRRSGPVPRFVLDPTYGESLPDT
jgi:hypothetical protein